VKKLRHIAVLVTFGFAAAANAASICPDMSANSDQEGQWRLSEDAFSEASARDALAKLEALLGSDGLESDAVAWQTSFIYLEGWYLKRQAQNAIKRGQPEPFVSDFCAFLRDRAYVRH
jgi:hypothetical protein